MLRTPLGTAAKLNFVGVQATGFDPDDSPHVSINAKLSHIYAYFEAYLTSAAFCSWNLTSVLYAMNLRRQGSHSGGVESRARLGCSGKVSWNTPVIKKRRCHSTQMFLFGFLFAGNIRSWEIYSKLCSFTFLSPWEVLYYYGCQEVFCPCVVTLQLSKPLEFLTVSLVSISITCEEVSSLTAHQQ
jgi:hypothetical protein